MKTDGRMFTHPGYLFWIGMIYLIFLGKLSMPITGDEKQYLSISLEMFHAHSWLTPLQFGEASYFKPPFLYWMTLLSFKAFGLSLFSALLPSVVMALGTAFFLGEISDLIYARRSLIRSGFLFMVTAGVMTYGVVAQMEIYLCFFSVFAWWAALKFLAGEIDFRRWRYLFLCFGAVGLLALVKSPLYSVLWTIGFVCYLVIEGEWEIFFERRLYVAVIFGTVIGLSWYLWSFITDHERFWSGYILRETLNKGQGNQSSAFRMWLAFFYQSLPIIPIFVLGARAFMRRKKSLPIVVFTFCYAWPFALFFSFFPYRVNNYLFILTPMVALLTDWLMTHERRSRWMRWTLRSIHVLVLTFSLTVAALLLEVRLVPPQLALIFGGVGVLSLISLLRLSNRGMMISCLGLILGTYSVIAEVSDQDLSGLKSAIVAQPDKHWVMIDLKKDIWHDVGLISLATHRSIERLYDFQSTLERIRSGSAVILSDQQKPEFDQFLVATTTEEFRKKLQRTKWSRWGRRQKIAFSELFHRKDPVQIRQSLSRDYEIISL